MDARRPSYDEPALYAEPEEPRTGPITPLRVVLLAGLLVGSGLAAYGLLERGASQVPILVAGLVLLGGTLLATSFFALRAAIDAARDGRNGRSFFVALFAGGCTLAAAGCLGGAVVLALLYGSAPSV
jgi:hypothetical protein